MKAEKIFYIFWKIVMADNLLQDSLKWMKSPERTQALQGIGGLLSSSIDRLKASSDKDYANQQQFVKDPLNASPSLMREIVSQGNSMTGFAPAGIFVGAGSRTWDVAMNKLAKELEDAGVSARDIWSKTGNWKAPDGKWRQEIPDNKAEFRTDFDSTLMSKANNYKGGQEGPIGGMMRHDDLYKAYPELLTTDRLTVQKLVDWLPDSANSGEYKRTFGGKGYLELRNKTEQGALNTGVHELQHSVQNKEGFQQGATESMFRDMPGATAFEQYQRQMGEAEARAAAARQMLTPQQRRELFPEDSYDMPITSLLSR
jgi:hypothetical protein